MADPFRLPTPFLVSFSGGRTSGYMLRRILDAFEGTLPDGGRVVFCNTGKERPETLDFVETCSLRWDVPMTWLEYRRDPTKPVVVPGRFGLPVIGCHTFAVVNYATASRDGRPLDEVLSVLADYRREAKGKGPPLPSRSGGRACTAEGKVRSMRRWLESLGDDPSAYMDAIGIRADEPNRVERIRRQTAGDWEVGEPTLPLADAGVTEPDVMAFWSGQPFDLRLRQDEGNCDLCMLKSKSKLLRLIRENPSAADWWIAHEQRTGQLWTNYFGPGGYTAAREQALRPVLLDTVGDDGIACHCTD